MLRGLCALVWVPRAHPLHRRACVRLSESPGPILCIAGLVGTCLGSPGSSSSSQGLCVLVSAPGSRSLHHRACVRLSGLPGPILCIVGLVCACLGIGCPASVSPGLCALVWAPWGHSRHRGVVCACLSSLGPPFITGFNFYI